MSVQVTQDQLWVLLGQLYAENKVLTIQRDALQQEVLRLRTEQAPAEPKDE